MQSSATYVGIDFADLLRQAKGELTFKRLGADNSRLDVTPAIPDTSDEEDEEKDSGKAKAQNLSLSQQDLDLDLYLDSS